MLTRRAVFSFLIPLVFLLHPFQRLFVFIVSMRGHLLTALFSLLTMMFYILYRTSGEQPDSRAKNFVFYLLSVVSFIAGLLSYVNSVFLFFVLLAYEVFVAGSGDTLGNRMKNSIRKLWPFAVLPVVYYCCLHVCSVVYTDSKLMSNFLRADVRGLIGLFYYYATFTLIYMPKGEYPFSLPLVMPGHWDAAYYDGKEKADNSAIQYLDKVVGNATLTHSIGKLKDAVSLQSIGERKGNISASAAAPGFVKGQDITIPACTLVHLEISYDVTKSMNVALSCMNVFEQNVLYPGYIRRRIDTIPGDSGRNVFGQIAYKF